MLHDGFEEQAPPIKNCPMCRLAMVGDRTDSRLAEFNHYRCLGCDMTITFTPSAPRQRREVAVRRNGRNAARFRSGAPVSEVQWAGSTLLPPAHKTETGPPMPIRTNPERTHEFVPQAFVQRPGFPGVASRLEEVRLDEPRPGSPARAGGGPRRGRTGVRVRIDARQAAEDGGADPLRARSQARSRQAHLRGLRGRRHRGHGADRTAGAQRRQHHDRGGGDRRRGRQPDDRARCGGPDRDAYLPAPDRGRPPPAAHCPSRPHQPLRPRPVHGRLSDRATAASG